MDPKFRFDRFVVDWLGPFVVVGVAMALGLVLFISENHWWPALAGPALEVLTAVDNLASPHR